MNVFDPSKFGEEIFGVCCTHHIRINGQRAASERLTFARTDENTEPPSLFIECKAFLIGMFFAVINWRAGGRTERSRRRSPRSCQVPPMMNGVGIYEMYSAKR